MTLGSGKSESNKTNQSGLRAVLRTILSPSKRSRRGSWRSLIHHDFQFFSSERRLRGWIRRDVSQELYRELTTDPEAFIHSPRAVILKDRPKSKLFRRVVEAPDGMNQSLLVKRVRYETRFRKVGFLFAMSPALRSLRGALILQQRGLHTPLPIAAIEPRSWRHLGTSYYIAEEIEDSQSLRALWQMTLPAVPRTRTLQTRKRVLEDVASLFHRLHSLGVFHQDLKGTNILLRDNEPEKQRLFLVDVGDVREPRRLLWQKRVRNLVQLCEIPGRFWTTREKAFFLKHYADLCGLSKVDRRALVHDVLQTTNAAKNRSRLRSRGPISFGGQV